MRKTILDLLESELRKARSEFGQLEAAILAFRSNKPFVGPSIDREWALNTLACASILSVHRRLVYVLEIVLARVDGYTLDADDDAARAQIIKAAALPVLRLRPAVISEPLRDVLLRLEWFFEEADGRYPIELEVPAVLEAVALLRRALPAISDEFSRFADAGFNARQADFFESKA